MRILYIGPNRIGDAVVASGPLDHVVRSHAGARVTVACGPAAVGVYEHLPGLEAIIPFEKRPRDMHWPALWWQVVRRRWDWVIDIRGSATGYLLRAGRRSVYRPRPGRKFEQYAAMLGLDPAPLPVAWFGPAERARAQALLGGGPVIGLGPTANWDGKLWPAERFAALVDELRKTVLPGAGVAVFGGPGERERAMAAPVLAAIPGAIDLVGALSLPGTAACMAECAVYVGNDSGPMHLAAATGAPTVGLLGATLDRAWEMSPAGRRVATAVADGPRMEALRVGTAVEAVRGLLAQAER